MVMMSVAVALLNVNAFRYPPAIRSSLSRLTYIEDHGVGGMVVMLMMMIIFLLHAHKKVRRVFVSAAGTI